MRRVTFTGLAMLTAGTAGWLAAQHTNDPRQFSAFSLAILLLALTVVLFRASLSRG